MSNCSLLLTFVLNLHIHVSHRITLITVGPFTFIKSTQLCGFPQHCNGIIISFCPKQVNKWYIGIVYILSVMEPEKLVLHKWNGQNLNTGVHEFMMGVVMHWKDVESHF